MRYKQVNRNNRPLCAVCGRPISLYFSGWRHVGPWRNEDGHQARPRQQAKLGK